MRVTATPGPTDSLTDIDGLKVGHAEDASIITGTSVIIPDAPVAMAADVRGGGPGTRETEALNPDCLVDRVHGLVLSGGSVFGLAAADRVSERLSSDGIGLNVGPRHVPVVPSAILFDLKNGGDKDWGDTSPYRRLADEAYAARSHVTASGRVGAGFGAAAGARPGGLGTASLATPDGLMVSAIVAVNSFGDVMEAGAAPLVGDITFPKLGILGGNTTIGAVATNLDLDKAGCRRLAVMAQDGLARTIRPIHTPFDGDTIFALATHARPVSGDLATTLALAGTLAADCLAVAVRRAVGV